MLIENMSSGEEIVSSPSRATWLQQLYRVRHPAVAAEDGRDPKEESSDSDEMDESRGLEEQSPDYAGKGKRKGKEGFEEDGMAPETPPPQIINRNPFSARIAAHAGCVKKLWRARYLALREVLFCEYVNAFLTLCTQQSRSRGIFFPSGGGGGWCTHLLLAFVM